jgi:hypothetical protein
VSDPIDAVVESAKAIGKVADVVKQLDAERNTPAMQDNAAAIEEAKLEDKIAKAIEQAREGAPTELRKLAAE